MYHLLEFNMPVDKIIETVGTPDMKLPELIGETWIWCDEAGINRIAVYLSPQIKWKIPETEFTPRLKFNTGKRRDVVYKSTSPMKS